MKKHIIVFFITLLTGCFSKEKKAKLEPKAFKTTEKIVLEKDNVNGIKENIRTFKIGVIRDKDGYTNIRKEENSSSEILGKIFENEYFFYKKTKTKNWCEIKTLKGKIGYIHSSRVHENTNVNLLSISTFVLGYDEKETRDTIMSIKNLNDAIFIEDFNYKQLKFTKKKENSISYYNKNIKVELSKVLFEENKPQIIFDDNEHTAINGEKTWGIEVGLPKYCIKQLNVLKNDVKIGIDLSEFNAFFEPNLDLAKVYETDKGNVIIWMTNGDGAGAYSVIFFLDDTKLIHKYIYRPF